MFQHCSYFRDSKPASTALTSLQYSTLVNLLTVDQAHKEFNSLVDKLATKYQQLDFNKFGAVGTPGFNAKN